MNTLIKTCLIVLGLTLGGAAANAVVHDVDDGYPAGIFAEETLAGTVQVQSQAPASWIDDAFASDE